MRSSFKLVLVTLPLMAVGVGFVAWTISTKPAPAQAVIAERAASVRVIIATETAVAPKANGFGLVAPARSYDAIAQVTGTAEYVNPALKNGEILPEGAVIVRLSDSDYNLAIAQARANIRAAEAKLDEIAVSEENLKASLEIEQETLTLKAAELERMERLAAAGTASTAARDAAKTAWLVQRQKTLSVQNSLALLPSQREVQKEQIAAQKIALETAQLNLERTSLGLPFTARVGNVAVEIGQLVRTGQTVASFDGIDAAEVEAQISASDLQKLFRQFAVDTGDLAGTPADISETLGGLPIAATVRLRLGDEMVEWPAAVDRVSNSIDPKTGTVGIIVRVDNAYASAQPGARPPLTKGMFVEVVLTAAPVAGIVIPRAALRGGEIMLAGEDSRLHLTPVEVGFKQGDIALVTGGLEPGARIVVSTPVPLIDGLLLDPQPDEALMVHLAAAGADPQEGAGSGDGSGAGSGAGQ